MSMRAAKCARSLINSPYVHFTYRREGGRECAADRRPHISLPQLHWQAILHGGINQAHQFPLHKCPDNLSSVPLNLNSSLEVHDEQHTGIILTSEVCVREERSGDLANGRRDVWQTS
jgi:hypothetical protein